MSLDVYLDDGEPYLSGSGIFIRENGSTREISRAEWDAKFPGSDPVIAEMERGHLYTANITHNLAPMAVAAGIHKHLWRPDEIGIKCASELVAPLKEGLARLQSDPVTFRQHNPPNGWGTYEGLINFVAEYVAACEANPDATVRVWR